MNDSAPELSIVIPVHDEEAMLRAAVVDLRERLAPHSLDFEIILAENGSRDATAQVARELSARYPEVRLVQSPSANYGRALRQGIESARGRWVICEEIDLCDVDFQLQALELLRAGRAELVIGSKLIAGARDERPQFRRVTSRAYSALLRLLFDFRGTDTHGLKAFERRALLPVLERCQVDGDVLASELVLRAYRAGLGVLEVPVRVLEKRPPSIDLHRRVPGVLKNLWRLSRALRRDA